MNSFGQALEHAVLTVAPLRLDASQKRAALETEFRAALETLQFRADSESVVLPVPEAAAREWADGKISDLDLVLKMNGRCEAIWWPVLPHRRAYGRGRTEARQLVAQGARSLISYTVHPVVAHTFIKHGGHATFTSPNGGQRFFADRAALERWLT